MNISQVQHYINLYPELHSRIKIVLLIQGLNNIEGYKITRSDPKELVESYKKRFLVSYDRTKYIFWIHNDAQLLFILNPFLYVGKFMNSMFGIIVGVKSSKMGQKIRVKCIISIQGPGIIWPIARQTDYVIQKMPHNELMIR